MRLRQSRAKNKKNEGKKKRHKKAAGCAAKGSSELRLMFVFIATDGPCVGIGVCMYVGGSVWGQDESRGGSRWGP